MYRLEVVAGLLDGLTPLPPPVGWVCSATSLTEEATFCRRRNMGGGG